MTGAPPDASAIYFGKVMHRRLRPLRRPFAYRVFSLFLDIDRLAESAAGMRLFGYNRARLFSFRDSDHGERDGSPLRPWIERQLHRAGMDLGGGRIMLLCFPRLFGYVFNPLSIFFCYDARGALTAVLYEVKNTYGEQHSYLIAVTPRDGSDSVIRQQIDKRLYVSPFMDLACTYHFHLQEPDERLQVSIRQTDEAGDLLIATQIGTRAPLDDWQLLKGFVLYPLMTLKVIAAIHWQAVRLWLSGEPVRRHPAKPSDPLSIAEMPRSSLSLES
jgi:uncharacterized protein